MKTFKANAVGAEELADLNAFCLVLAESPDSGGACLEIQRALMTDEQDQALGQATYCLSTEGGAVHYGGIEGWVLERGTLEIQLDAEAAGALGVSQGFSIRIDPEKCSLVQESMMKLLS